MSAPIRKKSRLLPPILAIVSAACGANQSAQSPSETAAAVAASEREGTSASDATALSDGEWANQTFSPQLGSVPDPNLEPLVAACGEGDAALHDVAAFVAEAQSKSGELPDLDAINFELRRRGSPHVMPRLWAASASGVAYEQLAEHVSRWASGRPRRGTIRCGAGIFRNGRGVNVAVLQVDVVAELSPIPTRVEAGTWLNIHSRFLLPTTASSIVLLSPDGTPRTVPATLKGDDANARVSLPTAGTWLIQVMATQAGGPLPVASALVTAGDAPPAAMTGGAVPGEKAYDPRLSPDEALLGLVNAARQERGLPTLRRNKTLDGVAVAHSERMRERGQISHDTGHGDPGRRVAEAGLSPRATGENVAMASTVVRLHRALWASPSHRENLLLRRWDEVGIGIVQQDDGSLMATQLFIDVR